MKVIILAAGIGSRLGDTKPKCLTRLISGKSILEHQLLSLSAYISLDRVQIVVGYHKEEVLKKFPKLSYVDNPHYADENTSKSLLRALKHCEEDLLWLNGDVLFHSSALEKILASKETCMLVNCAPVEEEAVKYRQDAEGRILEVSKTVFSAQGEALGINFWLKKDLPSLRRNLEKCRADDYFERGIQLCIDEGMEVRSVPIDPKLCTEIDFPEDLGRANALLSLWQKNP